MTTQSPSSYVANKLIRMHTPFTISNGKCFYVENGIPYTEEEFHQRYPLYEKVRHISEAKMKGKDIDHTHIH